LDRCNAEGFKLLIRADSGGLELIGCATVEHGFQACKALDPDQRRLIAAAPTPAQAKRLGRRASLRPDWEQVREDVMRMLLAQKFRLGEPLALRLLATGNAELTEGNRWGDRYWGVADGVGQNRLGQLLMQRRAELRTALREQTLTPCRFWTAAPGGDDAAPRDPQGCGRPNQGDRERDLGHERR
jgi:ribA/ribD-fused uncharacterized protein